MEITLNLTATLIMIFVIHTIFTHLLNWMIREVDEHELTGLTIFLNIIELSLCIIFIMILTK